ncbi:MAG: divalent-cation tolerance protein CutA [Planctomycetota bacterium]|nr:divalent-cation tolerance protein CutA [Planctomycetota bacterium]
MLRVVLVTAPANKAELLARQLLEERLVACINLVPGIHSMYWWGDQIQTDTETLMLMKTRKGGLKRLFKRIKRIHPYEVPEIVALPPEAVYEAYDQWVTRETKKPKGSARKAKSKKKVA